MDAYCSQLLVMFVAIGSVLSGCGGSAGTTTTTTTTTSNTTSTPTQPVKASGCLCLFDIDRTLTGKQDDTKDCPMNSVQAGVSDDAYTRGSLTLSELALKLSSTFCHTCYIGTISAGDASGAGSKERANLAKQLQGGGLLGTSTWNAAPGCVAKESPLLWGCPDHTKQTAVPTIQQWYSENRGVTIADVDVHFFDDRADNINPFQGRPYNARQISCATRDKSQSDVIGLCGAAISEIKQDKGVVTCPKGNANTADKDALQSTPVVV